MHVTLRATRRLPSLRRQVTFAQVRRALVETRLSWFRVVHFSVQADHVHLLVEARDKICLSRGVAGLTARMARSLNRVLGRRGRLWSDRFHARALRTPREVRRGLVDVIMNWRKHVPEAMGLDPCSSAEWFEGWKAPPATGTLQRCAGDRPLAPSRTWLLAQGWKRHGLLGPNERPRGFV